MKTISVLKKLINVYFYFLVFGFIASAILLIIRSKKGLPATINFYKEEYDISNLSFWQLATIMVIVLVFYSLIIRAIYLLKRCVNDLYEGNYFSELIISNFKKIGKILLILGVGTWFFGFVFSLFIVKSNDIRLDGSLILPVIMGLFFMFLSEVFSKARKSEEENNLTV